MIEMKCAVCGHTMRFKDENTGRVGQCPRCQEKFRVPSPYTEIVAELVEPPKTLRLGSTGWVMLVCGLFVLLMCLGMLNSVFVPAQPSSSIMTTSEPKASHELQTQRTELVQRMIIDGVFLKIETPGSIPRVYCTIKWHTATIDQKQQLAYFLVVWAYELPNDAKLKFHHIIKFMDATTGKEFATMSQFGYIEE